MAAITPDQAPQAGLGLAQTLPVTATPLESEPSSEPFRFLDLPKEIRIMIYENLMDNRTEMTDQIKPTQPVGFEVECVNLENMYYPALLGLNKIIHAEYWHLCLQGAVLFITYGVSESFHHPSEDDEDDEDPEEPELPLLSKWTHIPLKALAKITEVLFKFESGWELPVFNPFFGIPECVREMPSLKFLSIWCELDMSLVDFSRDQAEKDLRFQAFIEDMYNTEFILDEYQEDTNHRFPTSVHCDMYTPLYEMNKRFIWPRRRHLEQGVAPLAGLPEWGHAMFEVVPPWNRPDDSAFEYHGEEVIFDRVTYELPVPERSENVGSPSEFDYSYDELGWATGPWSPPRDAYTV